MVKKIFCNYQPGFLSKNLSTNQYSFLLLFLTDKVLAEFDERLLEGMVLTHLQKALML